MVSSGSSSFLHQKHWPPRYNWENRRKPPTCRTWLTSFITLMVYRVHLTSAGVELTTLVVIVTDFIGNCKSNYHMITTTMTPRNTLRNACIQHFTWAFRFSGSIIIGIKIHRRYQNGTGSETSYLLFIYIIHCLSFFKNYKLESVFCTSDSVYVMLRHRMPAGLWYDGWRATYN